MPTRHPHERLVAYGKALDLAEMLEDVARAVPDWRRDLRDQLRRASASIALNLAEGAAEFSPAEKARFYRMARRSAAEAAAILDVVERTTGAQAGFRRAREGLEEVAAMLTALVKTAQAVPSSPSSSPQPSPFTSP